MFCLLKKKINHANRLFKENSFRNLKGALDEPSAILIIKDSQFILWCNVQWISHAGVAQIALGMQYSSTSCNWCLQLWNRVPNFRRDFLRGWNMIRTQDHNNGLKQSVILHIPHTHIVEVGSQMSLPRRQLWAAYWRSQSATHHSQSTIFKLKWGR